MPEWIPFRLIAESLALVTGASFFAIGAFVEDNRRFALYSKITIITGFILISILVAIRYIFY